jgi:uncharacterized protein DUF4287
MTHAKKLKKVIRARARKTGESYTVARRQVLKARASRKAAAIAKPVAAPRPPSLGAISDRAILKKTGHGLEHWFGVLDAFDPKAKGHTDRAQYLYDEHQVPGWHSQGIVVAYERERGIRVANQACDGSFQVSVSRAVPVSVAEVAAAIGKSRRRDGWLATADPALVRAVNAAFEGPKPRSVKLKDPLNANVRIPWDGSIVEIRIAGKPNGSTTVVADNKNLKQVDQVEQRRAHWKVALDALKAHLTRA